MPRFYSMDLRTRVMSVIAAGLIEFAQNGYEIQRVQTMDTLKKRLKETSNYAAKPL